jgi:hypothetical protein
MRRENLRNPNHEPASMKLYFKIIFGLVFVVLFSACKGYLQVGGTVTDGGTPVKGATVKVFTKKGELLTQTKTDDDGAYTIGRKATPLSRGYLVVFEKKGYKTDTTDIRKSRGTSYVICDHNMEKK